FSPDSHSPPVPGDAAASHPRTLSPPVAGAHPFRPRMRPDNGAAAFRSAASPEDVAVLITRFPIPRARPSSRTRSARLWNTRGQGTYLLEVATYVRWATCVPTTEVNTRSAHRW